MKSKIFLIAIGAFVAAMALGFTTVGRLAASPETAPPIVHLAYSTGGGTTRGNYCFSGARSEQDHLDRGWVCKNVP
jgi:hypothetical protein